MPIRTELRPYYENEIWEFISRFVRFERAHGRCEHCGRQQGQKVYRLPDGRTFWSAETGWIYPSGATAPYPDIVEFCQMTEMTVRLAAAHLDHDPSNNVPWNLACLCQWCHLKHDRMQHQLTRRSRLAIRDLFENAA